jgi:hypothetical protein
MRYYLKMDEDPRGMVLRPVPNGDSKDGVLSEGGFDLVASRKQIIPRHLLGTSLLVRGEAWIHPRRLKELSLLAAPRNNSARGPAISPDHKCAASRLIGAWSVAAGPTYFYLRKSGNQKTQKWIRGDTRVSFHPPSVQLRALGGWNGGGNIPILDARMSSLMGARSPGRRSLTCGLRLKLKTDLTHTRWSCREPMKGETKSKTVYL